MKSFINTKTFFPYSFFLLLYIFTACKSTSPIKSNQVLDIKPKILRLTYDSTWTTKETFELQKVESIHQSGNTYTLLFDPNVSENTFRWIRVSSTNQENRQGFPYLMSSLNQSAKVFYIPWKNTKISVVIQNQNEDPKKIDCRWEGLYNGYLLVVETEYLNNNGYELSKVAQIFHQYANERITTY